MSKSWRSTDGHGNPGGDSQPVRTPMLLRSTCKLMGCNANEDINCSAEGSPRSVHKPHHHHHHHVHSHSPHEVDNSTSVSTIKTVTKQIQTVESRRQTANQSRQPDNNNNKTLKLLAVKLAKLKSSASSNKHSDYSSGFDSSDSAGERGTKPKTDYTYARSRSYKSRETPSKDDLNPNMSRNALRVSGSKTDTSSDEEISHMMDEQGSSYTLHGQGSSYSRLDRRYRDPKTSTPFLSYNGQAMTTTMISHMDEVTHLESLKSDMGVVNRVGSFCTNVSYAILNVVSKCWLFVWRIVYRALCSVLMLDTWLLSRCTRSKAKAILFLLLIPLLVPLLLFLTGSTFSDTTSSSLNPSRIGHKITDTVSSFATKHQYWYSWLFSTPELNSNTAQLIDSKIEALWLQNNVKLLENRQFLIDLMDQTYSKHRSENDLELAKLNDRLMELNDENKRLKDNMSKMESNLNDIHIERDYLQNEILKLRNCCKNESSIPTEIDLERILFKILNDTNSSSGQLFFNQLDSKFMNRDFQHTLINMAKDEAKMAANLIALEELKKARSVPMPPTGYNSVRSNSTCPNVDEIKQIAGNVVRNALFVYDADKIGQVDYALESAGGSVISTRCAETYHAGTAVFSIFGIPVWKTANSPRTVIQPDIHPGQCWAFKGTQGYLVIELSTSIQATAFTLEHIPKSLAPSGKIDSAPKEFSVYGLMSEKDLEGVNLGTFTYRDSGESLQYFPVQFPDAGYFPIMELRILSNHGNMEYTCLYRFRVHGVPQ